MPLSLYIHIPFCQQKCLYCDFLSFPPASPRSSETIQQRYIDKLIEELRAMSKLVRLKTGKEKKYIVESIFVGGGTPSVLDPELIIEILSTIRILFQVDIDAEITIEVNPASTIRTKLDFYKKGGFNRLSIGLQSAINSELKTLGRIHRFEDFLRCYQDARSAGFDNINLDLIYGFPGQTVSSWKKSLRSAAMLKSEHLSIYNLIVEEGTPFFEMKKAGKLSLPDEDTILEMDKITKDICKRYGYERYEISNYAKPGYICRHNYGYWSNVPYIGFGLGASSYFEGERFKNIEDLDTYLTLDFASASSPYLSPTSPASKGVFIPEGLRKETRKLTRTDEINEFLFLGLRRTEGISELEFKERFSSSLNSLFGKQFEDFQRNGFMTHENLRYRFTEKGMDVSNELLSRIYL